MSEGPLEFHLVAGIRVTAIRAVGFLRGDRELTAWAGFEGLKPSRRKLILDSMGAWVEGSMDIGKRFHGWHSDSDPGVRECFVFKAKEGNLGHRLYGFLYHPVLKNPSFVVCALISYARKTAWESDRTELLHAVAWGKRAYVVALISAALARNEKESRRKTGGGGRA